MKAVATIYGFTDYTIIFLHVSIYPSRPLSLNIQKRNGHGKLKSVSQIRSAAVLSTIRCRSSVASVGGYGVRKVY
ncbi:hypothetical protein Q3G72_011459 [Acer saccharum]|nr:hypothetical protein Q3G72_011459 [Acer saccharum]